MSSFFVFINGLLGKRIETLGIFMAEALLAGSHLVNGFATPNTSKRPPFRWPVVG